MIVQTLTIWDSSKDPSACEGCVYTWNGYTEKDFVHSLLRYAETHGERLRRKYLSWIHDLGERKIAGKRIIDHLAFENEFSYWWMTLFVEQSPWKTPSIIDVIRLFALEEIILQLQLDKLRLVSVNRSLHEVLRILCQDLSIDYEWDRLPGKARGEFSYRSIYRRFPLSIQAVISLFRYVIDRWSFRLSENSRWFEGNKSLFLCSYFFNISSAKAEEGYFYSHYWEGLNDLLKRLGFHGNWLHLYYPHEVVNKPRIAIDWVKRFNRQKQEQEFHTFLDSYLSWDVVVDILKHWFRLLIISWKLRKIKDISYPQGSRISLWPIVRNDWNASLRGPIAISNILWIKLFDKSMCALPHQEKGLYICENQAWERAFIHAWRKYGHGQLIGVQHSTVRFWDLRYFTDPRTIRSSASYKIPQADLMALNGNMSVNAYRSIDYPKEKIVECEALRYVYLDEHIETGHTSRKMKKSDIKVLILGDYLPSNTIKMLKLLEEAVPNMDTVSDYTVKPHPNFIVKATDYPSLHLKIIMNPLGEILHDFDIAYSSNMTSACVDAYLFGLPIVVMLDETELNFSPLRNQSDVNFVSTPEELAGSFQKVGQNIAINPDHNKLFFLNHDLPRWRKLLQA